MRTALTVVLLAVVMPVFSGASEPQPRPRMRVRDAGSGCPGVSGSFVALLDPVHGMLLLSGAAFPGGAEARATGPGPFRLGSWEVYEISTDGGSGRAWWASYPFLGEAAGGCVAFDRDRFSAEGDLVSYLRWVVEKVYLQLPPAERARHPVFTLSGRSIALRVEQEGFAPLALEGREGSTLAFRVAGTETSCFLLPFVVGADPGRFAIRVALTARDVFAPKEADWGDFVLASPGEALPLPEVPARVVVVGMSE